MFEGGAIGHQYRRAWHTGSIPEWAEAIPPVLGTSASLDFDGAKSVSDFGRQLDRFAREFGFSGGRYVHIGHRVQLQDRSERPPLRFLSSLGDELDPWRAGDPSAPRAFQAFLPFSWDTRDNLDLPDGQRAWLSIERLRGVVAGVAIPIQDYMTGPAYLSLFGRTVKEAELLPRIEAPALLCLAIAFHNRAKQMLPLNSGQAVPLTDRELSCLRHAASGATISQTASFLGIANRTVELYYARAVRKLGALNRLHAVAIALSSGLIQI